MTGRGGENLLWVFSKPVSSTILRTKSVQEADRVSAGMPFPLPSRPAWVSSFEICKYLIGSQHITRLAPQLCHWNFSGVTSHMSVGYWRWLLRQKSSRVMLGLAKPWEDQTVDRHCLCLAGVSRIDGFSHPVRTEHCFFFFLFAWAHEEVIECFRYLLYGGYEPFNIWNHTCFGSRCKRERCLGTESNGDVFSPTVCLSWVRPSLSGVGSRTGHTIKLSLQLSLSLPGT